MWLPLLLACAEAPPPAVVPPAAHSWSDEAELVTSGLGQVVALGNEGAHDAARIMAERVYTERWQPLLEPALRKAEGVEATAEVEYAFGLLLVDLEKGASRARIEDRVRLLDARVREVATAAARTWPSPADLVAPPPPEPGEGSRPIVPDVRPKWEEPKE